MKPAAFLPDRPGLLGFVLDGLLAAAVLALAWLVISQRLALAQVEDRVATVRATLGHQAEALRTYAPPPPTTPRPEKYTPVPATTRDDEDEQELFTPPAVIRAQQRLAILNRSPEYAEFRRESQHHWVQGRYTSLIEQLHLDPTRETQFRRLLNEREDSMADTRELSAAEAGKSSDSFARQAIVHIYREQEAAIRKFLGEEGFALYQSHSEAANRQQAAEYFDTFLTAVCDLPALTPEQKTRVAQTLAAESRDRLARVVSDPLALNPRPNSSDYFRQHLTGELSEAQIAAYTDYYVHTQAASRLRTRARETVDQTTGGSSSPAIPP